MLIAGGLAGFVGCSSSSSGGFLAPGSDNASPSSGDDGGAASFGGNSSGGGSGYTADAGLPAEIKVENTFEAPVATRQKVWIANPASGRVAYIDAKTFAVQTVAAGNAPTYLAAVPNPTDDVAIVQNVLSGDATLLRVPANGGAVSAIPYPSTPDANSWTVSPSGRWAIAWANAQFVSNPSPTDGFQHLEVLDLSNARSPIVLAVGFRPSQVVFSGDESRAYAVTEDGLSVLDLTGGKVPSAVALYPLAANAPTPTPPADAGQDGGQGAEGGVSDGGSSPDASDAGAAPADGGADALVATEDGGAGGSSTAPDVSFTSDAAYALVRLDGSSSIAVVRMQDGASVAVSLPAAATDLTISPTGPTGAFAIAVMRDIASIAILPLPGIFADPGSFTVVAVPGSLIGRAIVTDDGSSALLFTTVAPVDSLTVLKLGATPTYRTVTLHAPVLAVFPAHDGQNAIVLHQASLSLGDNQGAFSLVPIGSELPALLQGLTAPPTAVAIAPTSDFALVSVRDDTTSTFGLYLAMMPSFDVKSYALASPPSAVGISAAAGRGYAAQDYPEGRITFVDFQAASGCDASSCSSSRTISGYDLNAGIVNGGN